ncbi:MAG TPA: alpha/beta fold hydrolase [Longimicrobiales bacterium]|nr:alpha/beta fold hydrolase [Longimicrobiales bacterium]
MPKHQKRDERRRARVDGAELYVRWLGDGPPVLCMHGGLGLDHTSFRPWLDPLSEDFSLIYYDHRGNGRSTVPDDWTRVDHEVWAEDAERLRLELGLERIFLFGHSYGAFLALEYAIRHPDSLLGLILCSAAPAMDYPDVMFANAAARATPEQLAAVQRAFTMPAESVEAVRDLWLSIVPVYVHGVSDDAARAAFDRTVYRPDAYARSIFECLPSYDVSPALPSLDVPTLVLSGRHDWATPPEQGGERLAALLPQAELVVFEDSGHYPFIEENAAFLETMRGWLERRLQER